MSITAFARTCACFGLFATAVTPSFAASAETEAFVANIRLRAVFIAKASELAIQRASSEKLRRFATGEGSAQVGILSDLETAPSPAPHDAVADLGQPTTGRSVGRDGIDLSTYSPPAGTGALMPAAIMTLDTLASLKGEEFDRVYSGAVRGVLDDEAAFYQAYVRTGDDEAIRLLAERQLARTTAGMASLD